jgi:hypothetical protein
MTLQNCEMFRFDMAHAKDVVYIQLYNIALWQLTVHCIKQRMRESSVSNSAVYLPVPR